MTMKSIINLTGKSELPARILAEIDAAEIIDIPFTINFGRAAEPDFAVFLGALLSDFHNAANAVVILPRSALPYPIEDNAVVVLPKVVQAPSPAIEIIRGFLPEATIIVL